MTNGKYEPAASFADGVEWCIASGLALDQSNIMHMRLAMQAARAFRAGLDVPERALLPHNSLPQPWRAEYERIQRACGAGVPSIADLKRTLPVVTILAEPLVPKHKGGVQPGSGPKEGGTDWKSRELR